MLKNKHVLYGVLGFVLANPAYAALVCTSKPTCATLGYTDTAVNCDGGVLMSCPLDKTYKKCIKPSVVPTSDECEILGFTNVDKSTWCPGGVVECPHDSSYTLCSNGLDCLKLGFTRTDKTSWCGNFVKCPYDKTLTLCAEEIVCKANQVIVGGKCVNAYESCEAAGYMADEEDGYYCSSSDTIYLLDGTTTSCYTSCHEVYSSCSAAGYQDAKYYDYCDGRDVSVFINEGGDYITCNTSCDDHPSTCEAAGYETEDNSKKFCSIVEEVSLHKGETTCYDDCVDVYSSCSAAGYHDPAYYDYCTGEDEEIYINNSGATYTCNTTCGQCAYPTQASCESKYKNSACTADANGCFEPTACKTNYAKSCSKPYYITGKDENGCGSCITDCQYLTQASCESKFTNSVCAADSNNCYAPTGCKTGYATSCTKPYTLTGKDSNGCGTCTTTCQYLTQASCETKFTNSVCAADSNNCYAPTSCKSGYVSSCTSPYYLNGADGNNCGKCKTDCSWTTESACESANANVECGVESGCYVPVACKTGYVFVTN